MQIGKYFLEHAMSSFKIAGLAIPQEEKDAKYILKRLDTYDFKADPLNTKNTLNTFNMKKGDLWQLCKGHFHEVEEMQPGLNVLTKRNYIRIERKKTGQRGRPTEVIEVNPAYWEQQSPECKTWVAGEF